MMRFLRRLSISAPRCDAVEGVVETLLQVLDVGGGTGSFLIAILRKHPTLQGMLFELSGACAVARQRLAGVPEAPRVTVVEGDFLKDPLPGGHDALIIANVVHVLSAGQNLELMKSMRAQVSPGTKLLLVDLWMDETHKEPRVGPLMSGEFLLISGEGQTYSENEAHEWLIQTNWHLLERRSLAGPASVIIAEAI